MNQSNGLIGDMSATELPESPLLDRQAAIDELKRKAKYSRSTEFKELSEKMQERITYYQSFLPGGVPVEQVSEEERGKYWAVANIVIRELQAVIDMYQSAQEQVKQLDE